ncbi:MAG TPA: NAD(P)-binding protein [Bryobacteraceae bacterium]|nr:NAD(P)-binding protein [Bryobacteraceae bacterium]
MEGRRALVISRRQFIAAPALVGLWPKTDRKITGGFVNDSFALGHRLRDRAPFRVPAQQLRVPIVIVGGGMAGLNAGWHLDKRGFRDFVLLEMEQQGGGNSRSGENEISKFPWAAHYVPVPAKGESLARELFEELGVFRDGKWDERVLCFDPQERLFINGHWQEGIEPEDGATRKDREQYRRFVEKIGEFRATGQFTVPMERGAKPSLLDQMSIADWMTQQGFDSAPLRWYINYACRDDYGALAKDTSAWAGIQYFASREPEEKGPLTWPEGNGWIAARLIEKLKRYIRTGEGVYRVVRGGNKFRVLTERTEYVADAVIWAAPTFLAPYVIEGASHADGFQYSPWLTANLTLDRIPEQKNAEPAWDNVIYDSPALGYVNATHMSLATHVDRTVWTFYWSLAEYAPADARRLLLAKDWNFWKEAILNDLARAHPDIRPCVAHIDIMRIGHAMARPSPGFLFSEQRERWLKPASNMFFANSDLSGFSIFEEAQYRGVEAAKGALRVVGQASPTKA